MKTRTIGGTTVSLTRLAFVSVLGVVAMTATAHLAAPPRSTSAVPADRPGLAVKADVAVAAITIAPRSGGVVEVDGASLRALAVGEVIDISPLAGLATERFEVGRRTVTPLGVHWWRLDSAEFEESQAVLVELDGFVSMWMQSPKFGDRFEWNFDPIGRGRSVPTPRATDLPGCGGSLDAGLMGPDAPETGAARMGEDQECAGCGALDADIAFFYTQLVREQVEADLEGAVPPGDPEDAPDIIAVRCAQECANATAAMDNTELPFGTRLVHVSEVDFDEQGEGFLGRFAGTDDGDMDEIHEIRDETGADACSLITLGDGGGGYCGVAYLGNGDSPGAAFSNLVWGCTGGLVFAHEFGHNLGLCHAAGDGGGCDEVTECNLWEPAWAGCCMPDATGPATPAPTYNHGWRWVNELSVPACVFTVMAYGKTQGGLGSTRIPYFSSPEVDYLGTPTGSPEDDPDGRWADNARVLRENMPGTIQYRCESSDKATDEGRLVPNGLAAADFFGQSVATNGSVLAVGAPRHDVVGTNAGAVFIFTDPDEDDLGWIQTGKLTPSDLVEGDRFGESVAMSDMLLAVGAPYTHRYVFGPDEEILEDHPLAGAASVWESDGAGGYCRLGDSIQPDDLQDYDLFGTSVAVAGDLLAVGAPRRDVGDLVDAGAVWVFQRMGDLYELVEVIEGTTSDGRFGHAVAASVQPNGDIMLLIGAPREVPVIPASPVPYGRVHPVRYVDTGGTWVAAAGNAVQGIWLGGLLGSSVHIRGEDAIAGAPGANLGRGAARAFRVAGAELESAYTIELGTEEGDHAGRSVAITDTFAAVSVPGYDVTVEVDDIEILLDDIGMVAVFNREAGDIDWSIRQVVRPADLRPGDRLGASVALAGNRLFAGAPEGEGDDAGPLSGVVYAVDVSAIVDCNDNGIDDSVDIFTGTSIDHDGDGVPDECQVGLCSADLNQDGVVGGADMGLLLMAWGECPDLEPGCLGDLDGNGSVGGPDLGLFCASWGLVCDPPKP